MKKPSKAQLDNCKTHAALLQAAQKSIQFKSWFSWKELIEEEGCHLFADLIQWKYIRKRIEESVGLQMIPVTKHFFTVDKDSPELQENPARFVAIGRGSPTAGYLMPVDDDHGGIYAEIQLHYEICREAQSAGQIQSCQRLHKQTKRSVGRSYDAKREQLETPSQRLRLEQVAGVPVEALTRKRLKLLLGNG